MITLKRITSKFGGSVKQHVILYYVSLSLNIKFCNLSPSRKEKKWGHFRIMYSKIRSYVDSTVMEKIWQKWAEIKATDIVIRCLKCRIIQFYWKFELLKSYGFGAFTQTPIEIWKHHFETNHFIYFHFHNNFLLDMPIKYMQRVILGSKEIGWK